MRTHPLLVRPALLASTVVLSAATAHAADILTNLAFEADKTGKAASYGMKFGLRF